MWPTISDEEKKLQKLTADDSDEDLYHHYSSGKGNFIPAPQRFSKAGLKSSHHHEVSSHQDARLDKRVTEHRQSADNTTGGDAIFERHWKPAISVQANDFCSQRLHQLGCKPGKDNLVTTFCSGWKPTHLTSVFSQWTSISCHLMVLY
jgi:hypothetical protein